MGFSKFELVTQLQVLGLKVEGNYVKRSDIEKILTVSSAEKYYHGTHKKNAQKILKEGYVTKWKNYDYESLYSLTIPLTNMLVTDGYLSEEEGDEIEEDDDTVYLWLDHYENKGSLIWCTYSDDEEWYDASSTNKDYVLLEFKPPANARPLHYMTTIAFYVPGKKIPANCFKLKK